MSLIKIKYKVGHGGKEYYISEDRFNKDEMILIEEDNNKKKKYESNILDIINSKSAPGISKPSSGLSTTYNNKLDSGAVENLLDVGLDKAKKRADERNKKYGSSFHKVKRSN